MNNIQLHTKRLQIIPLETEDFKALLESGRLTLHTQEAMEGLYHEALRHPEFQVWHTNWLISRIYPCTSVGRACFMKQPDENGLVETGYGIDAEHQGARLHDKGFTGHVPMGFGPTRSKGCYR